MRRQLLAVPALSTVPFLLVLGCGESTTSPAPETSLASEVLFAHGGGGLLCALATQLRPDNENPPAVASEAKGHIVLRFGNDGILKHDTYILNKGNETFVAGHIHRAPDDVNGPVVVTLYRTGPSSDEHIRDRNTTPVSPALAMEICANPTAFYVNYHTTLHPGGAVRGQLGPPGNN